ncbi:MAG: ABC transporter permease [Actinobacteria bacterium]|nr:ABC transporter permease [Actinomycetota bacterium]
MTGTGIATVARQEFRLRIRAGRWRLLLAIWFAVLLLFTVLLRSAIGGFNGNGNDISDKGVIIYGGLMLFVLGLALLVVPALAAQSVNGDRERGTLATLQVTRLTAADIALGKFAAAWGTSLVFLALTLPLVAYAITQKGVPISRTLVVTLVLALLLGTVCAVSLALSAVLSRTTTSGVLAYLAVFALTVGTLIAFGLVTATTSESYTETYTNDCPSLPPEIPEQQRTEILANCGKPQTVQSSRVRTDRTWWLLAPNPFVVLADAAPRLPPETAAQRRARQEREARGAVGLAVRPRLRRPAGRRGPDAHDPPAAHTQSGAAARPAGRLS